MTARNFLTAIMMVLGLLGCAMNPKQPINLNMDQSLVKIPTEYAAGYQNKDAIAMSRDFMLEPADTAGISEMSGLLQGRASAFKVPTIPLELKKEQPDFRRIRWNALTIARGYESRGQLLNRDWRKNDGELLIDGDAETLKDAKVLPVSTRVSRVYDLKNPDQPGILIDSKKFKKDPEYRRSLMDQYGTPLSNFERTDDLIPIINTWNRFEYSRGFILTPLDEQKFREIVDINSGLTHGQRLVRDGKWFISTDPISMAISVVTNNAVATMSHPNSWDIESEKSRTGGK